MKQRKFMVLYMHNGKRCFLDIPAPSFEEAEARLRSLTFGRVTGEIVADVPYAARPLVQAACFVRNLFLTPQR